MIRITGRFQDALYRAAPGIMKFSTWAEVYLKILGARHLKAKTLQGRQCNVRHLVEALGPLRLRSVRPVDVAIVVREIWDSGRPFTARRVRFEAIDMLNEAVLHGLIKTNPALPVKKLPSPVTRERLTASQFTRMLEASTGKPPWVRPMLVLAILTGQRRADLQSMRFTDIVNRHIRVHQQKTGARIELPLDLRLDIAQASLEEAINACRDYAAPGLTLLRKRNGGALGVPALTYRFTELFRETNPGWDNYDTAPTLHETRSLSERIYRSQGIDTRTLLGHKHQSQTDEYNDDRGLSRQAWVRLELPPAA